MACRGTMAGVMQRRRCAAVAALAALGLAGCGGSPEESAGKSPTAGASTRAPLTDASGAAAGTVVVTFSDRDTTFTIEATKLPPGLHGLHVHKVGRCEASSADPANPSTTGPFLSAGAHLAAEGQQHGAHDGDLPTLLVGENGTARLAITSDRLTRATVLDTDGSALVVHAMADNLANIPTRYAESGPDDMTRKTGDSGPRIACAVLTGP
jgi:Cu-Zn family superoxide dismutase